MGGDEFVILLPGVNADDVGPKLEQLQNVVKNVCRDLFGEDLLGASTGVAVYPADGRDARTSRPQLQAGCRHR